jgi:hypothetical protein
MGQANSIKREENISLSDEVSALQEKVKDVLLNKINSQKKRTEDKQLKKGIEDLHSEYQSKLNSVQAERRKIMEELKRTTGELETEEELSIGLKKKNYETQNEVFTL